MAANLEEDRLYTSRAIMGMGYMIRHGSGSPYAIEPGKSWPRYELVPEGSGNYRVKGKLAKESSFAGWLEAKMGTSSASAPGFSNQKGPGTASHRKDVKSAAERDREEDRHRMHKALARGKRAVSGGGSAEGGGDADLSGGLLGPAG